MVSEVEEGIIRLANALDTEGMIGFTRLFVQDLRKGRDAVNTCLLYTSPSPRDVEESRMPSSA